MVDKGNDIRRTSCCVAPFVSRYRFRTSFISMSQVNSASWGSFLLSSVTTAAPLPGIVVLDGTGTDAVVGALPPEEN
jgi:hypothetical protein